MDHICDQGSRNSGRAIRNLICDIPHLDPVLGDRRYEALQLAVWLAIDSSFTSGIPARDEIDLQQLLRGGGALGAVYLLGTLEQLFRRRCRFVNLRGEVEADAEQLTAILNASRSPEEPLIGRNRLRVGGRLNQIHLTLRGWLYDDDPDPLARKLRDLDMDGVLRPRLSLRLRDDRNPAMHGEIADLSAEARFLALLVGMFVYDRPEQPAA